MTELSMADLMAKQDAKSLAVFRGQEIEGEIITITDQELILDLGKKSEGVLQKKDLSPEQAANLKVGDKLLTFVIHPENESGQIVLGLQRVSSSRAGSFAAKFDKFVQAQKNNQVLNGKGLEFNKGGLIVEIGGVRGFLPSSQVTLSQAANLDELVGKDVAVTVIEVDSSQNRLIFSQKTNVSEDTKKKLSSMKIGDKVSGEVAAVLPFGVFVSIEDGVEGLVHVSEISWEKVDDPNTVIKIGDKVEAKVISIDSSTGRVNLSIKQLEKDPFEQKAQDLQPDDVVKVTIVKMSPNGVHVTLENGIEGLIQTAKMDADTSYEPGQTITCLVDSVDNQKRRVNLVPFITSTKDLIYK